MSNLPQDNTAVDDNKRFIKGWLDYQRRLEPASTLSTSDVAAIKALIGSSGEIETGDIGDIQYRGAEGLVNLPIGAVAGMLLGVNAARTAPEWGSFGSWLNLISETIVAGVNSVTLTGFGDYNHLLIKTDNIIQSGSGLISIELYGAAGLLNLTVGGFHDRASTLGSESNALLTFAVIDAPDSSADVQNGVTLITNIKGGRAPQVFSWSVSTRPSIQLEIASVQTAAPIDSILLKTAAVSFTSGTAALYGLR